MSICLVSKDWNRINGPGTYVKDLSSTLDEMGSDFILVCPKPNASTRGNYRYPRHAEVIEVPIQSYAPHLYWLFFGLNARIKVNRIQKTKRIKVIHVVDARGYLPNGKVPTIGTVHDSYIADVPLNPFLLKENYYDWIARYLYYNFARAFERLILPKYSLLIFNSYFTKKEICSKYNIPNEMGKIINPSVATPPPPSKTIDELRSNLKTDGDRIILFIGMNFQRKGLKYLLKAAPFIIPELKLKIIVIGGSRRAQQRMYQLCRSLKVESNVIFLGTIPHSKIFDYYYLADVLVVPSLVEAFGRVYLEAMSTGTPVIGGIVGGTSEVIKDGHNGFLVNPLRTADLANTVKEVLTKSKLRKKLIQNGKKTADLFNINNMVNETIRLYDYF